MEQENNKKLLQKNIKQKKIYRGAALIVLSPVLGSLLFFVYNIFLGGLIYTDGAMEMFWFSCIFSVAMLGLATVIVGCSEKDIEHKNNEMN